MPDDCPPNCEVTIEQVDKDTWLVKRYRPGKNFKVVLIPAIDKVPADPEWEKVEAAFGRAAHDSLKARAGNRIVRLA
jgi:hypothetical protein